MKPLLVSGLLGCLVLSTSTAQEKKPEPGGETEAKERPESVIPKLPHPDDVTASMKRAVSFFRTQLSFAGGYAWTWKADLSEAKAEGKPKLTLIGIQPPGTPSVGLVMLRAWQATGDPLFLQGAKEAAQALTWCQLASGGWPNEFDFDPRRASRYHFRRDLDGGDTDPGKRRAYSSLDDNKTQGALLFLTELASDPAMADDPALKRALEFAWDGLLAAQAPNGGWPQMFDGPADPEVPVKKASIPAEWSRTWPAEDFYPAYYTLNDNNLQNLMDLLLRAHELRSDDKRLLAAAKKLGDFLLLAQHAEPQAAWSQQYNWEMEPAWARKFEPPSICTVESLGAIQALIEIWLATGDDKYIATIPTAIGWLEEQQLPDGKWARFYELGTGNPLYCRAETYEVTYDDSNLPTHYGFKIDSGFGNKLKAVEARLAKGRDELLRSRKNPDSKEGWTKQARSLASTVKRAMESQKQDGRWQKDDLIESKTFVRNLETMSSYVEAASEAGEAFKSLWEKERKREEAERKKREAESAKAESDSKKGR